MQTENTTNHSGIDKRQRMGEIIRFGVVGALATLIQYGIYLLLLTWTHATVANTVGYVVSFAFNFMASTLFTFRVKPNAKRGAWFALCHVINYLLQTASLACFIYIGIPKSLAPIPMFAICVPVNFILVRHFMRR
ncbi:GtrA family protein [Hallella colorans]|uniref:GtrA family protein n=1 Tax=Hallella colorans TaxID=1703337 RepID=UPI00288C45E0|nr:GtrA family protein [Hallella colorans]